MDPDALHRAWRERDAEYSPRYYAYRGPDETSRTIADVIESKGLDEPSILELGCSAGRHLAHLYEQGYRDLAGIDINAEAFEVMAETAPELEATGTFYVDSIEDAVTDFDPGQFDVVFSVETLQHIHHDQAWVFEAIAEAVGDLLVVVEREPADAVPSMDTPRTYVVDDIPLYYRDWGAIFTDLGLSLVETRDLGRDTLWAFGRDQ